MTFTIHIFPIFILLERLLRPEMDFITFFELPLEGKIQTLYKEGTFVVSIRYYGYKINLYMIDGHYMEVFYNHKFDRIEKIEPLDPHHTRVKFYTDQIKLPEEILG